MLFSIDVTDPRLLAGLTAAREAHNNGLIPERDAKGDPKPINTHPDFLANDNAYVAFVMTRAMDSYAKSFGFTSLAALEAEKAAVQAKIDRLEALDVGVLDS